MPERIDLLYMTPRKKADTRALRSTLSVAFVAGEAGNALTRGLEIADSIVSEFKPECFAQDLFAPELIKTCFNHGLSGIDEPIGRLHLVRLLIRPPSSDVARFRQEILRELRARPELRSALQTLYCKLIQFRSLLDGQGRLKRRDHTRRRIETLAALTDIVRFMEAPFRVAKTGLNRLDSLARHALSTAEFQQLESFVRYDEHLATLDVRLRVGADGSVRGIQLVHLEENAGTVFYTSPVARFFARIKFMFRGYRVPMEGLLERCLDQVFEGVLSLSLELLALIGDLEFYLGGLHFADLCEERGLQVSLPHLIDATPGRDRRRKLTGLFNPLLFAQETDIVPADIEIDSCLTTTIVTGPNSGGKTRLLQALALTQLLGQAGLFVPAASAELPVASGLFLSLSHPLDADQREGRLGSELIRIRALFEQLNPNSLVIIDELCSGTNPSEGQEIFLLVVSLLRELHPETFVTTHFLQFAASLQKDASRLGLRFLQVELDENQRPTFQFVPGVAETSLAQQTAERLGVTRAELLSLIGQKRRSPSLPPSQPRPASVSDAVREVGR